MNLIQEYRKQQKWRNWERYLEFIPLNKDDSVLDLGCSVGNVSHLLTHKVNNVVGIDINQVFIDFCVSNKISNEAFLCSDLLDVDYSTFKKISGIWGSFSLSYLSNPKGFLQRLNALMEDGGWIALLDISCFISGNLPKNSKYYDRVSSFELESHKNGIYDFDFGSKMQTMLQKVGFEIIYVDNDVYDPELNFSGVASDEIIDAWSARLNRMEKLREKLGTGYSDFSSKLLSNLSSESHEKRGCVRFVVAIKPNKLIQPNT